MSNHHRLHWHICNGNGFEQQSMSGRSSVEGDKKDKNPPPLRHKYKMVRQKLLLLLCPYRKTRLSVAAYSVQLPSRETSGGCAQLNARPPLFAWVLPMLFFRRALQPRPKRRSCPRPPSMSSVDTTSGSCCAGKSRPCRTRYFRT